MECLACNFKRKYRNFPKILWDSLTTLGVNELCGKHYELYDRYKHRTKEVLDKDGE